MKSVWFPEQTEHARLMRQQQSCIILWLERRVTTVYKPFTLRGISCHIGQSGWYPALVLGRGGCHIHGL